MSKITDLFKKKENQGERKSEKALASFSHWVMTHKTIIISIFAVLMILAVVGNFFVHKQSDVISYLDNDTATKQGLANLQKEYNIIGDFSMGISYLSEEQMTELISKIQSSLDTKVEEVVDEDGEYVLDENGEIVTKEVPLNSYYYERLKYINKIVWYGTFSSLKMLNNTNAFSTVSPSDVSKILEKMKSKFVIHNDEKDVDTYLVSIYFTTANSADETATAIDTLEEIIQDYIKGEIKEGYLEGPKDVEDYYTFSGSAENSRSLLKSSVGDMPKFVIVAVIAVFIILFLTTKSYIEPLIFLATLGISILLNMGSNIIAGRNPVGTISSITASCATILQLAVAMDYAIFLMHTYYEELRTTPRPEIALEQALPKTIKSVVASSLTTVGSFIALFFMKFGIGYDLGFVLAKGVILSLITVVLLQPVIILFFHKWIAATNHETTKSGKHQWEPLTPRLKFVSKIITKKGVAIPIIVVCIALLIPAAMFQSKVDLAFITVSKENPNPTVSEQALEASSNQLIVMTPYTYGNYDDQYVFIKDAYLVGYKQATTYNANEKYYEQDDLYYTVAPVNKGSENEGKLTEAEFANGVYYVNNPEVNTVTDIFSLCTIFLDYQLYDIDTSRAQAAALARGVIYRQLHNSFVSHTFTEDNVIDTDTTKTHYMLYTMTIDGSKEDEKSYASVLEIQKIAKEVYKDYSVQTQMTGNVLASYELSQVTPSDYTLVNILTVVIIFLILLFTFKSPLLAAILVMVIETGIWINLSASYFMGTTLHFMAYLIVSAIALGATVDYAILVTSKYLEEKQNGATGQAAIRNAIYRAAPGVLTSGSIFFVACLAVYLVSTNIIVQQITLLLARNAVLSVVLVFSFLPAILSMLERAKKYISIKRGKGDPDEGKSNTSIYSVSSKKLKEFKQVHEQVAVAATDTVVDVEAVETTQTEESSKDE